MLGIPHHFATFGMKLDEVLLNRSFSSLRLNLFKLSGKTTIDLSGLLVQAQRSLMLLKNWASKKEKAMSGKPSGILSPVNRSS